MFRHSLRRVGGGRALLSNVLIGQRRPCSHAAAAPSSSTVGEAPTIVTPAPGSGVKPGRLIREAIAIAAPTKYRLADVIDAAASLRESHGLEQVFTFPKPRRDATGPEAASKLTVPFEIVVFRSGDTGNHLAVLADGTMVAFGLWQDEVEHIRNTLRPFEDTSDPCAWGAVEVLQRTRYTTASDLPALGFEKPADVESSYIDEGELDAIVLEDDAISTLIPFVYCLSRRVQIEACSTALKPLAAEVGAWRLHMGETGKLPVTVKQCRVRKASTMRLFAAQTRIPLRPRIFSHHEYNSLRHIYGLACEHFELSERSEALRARIESAAQSLSYMGDEANHKTNHRLEVVICVLIFTEIVIHLFVFGPDHH